MTEQTEIRTAKTILQKGVKVPLVTPPLLFRMFGKRAMNVTLRQSSMGGELMISALIKEMGLTREDFNDLSVAQCYAMIDAHGPRCMQIIAISILRRPPFIWAYRRYARWLTWRIEPSLVAYALHLILTLGDVEGFITTIRLLATERANILSPKIRGSQKADTSPASIAPGE